MSLVIGNGVRFKITDIGELHKRIMKWRERVTVLARESEAKYIAKQCVTILDSAKSRKVELDQPNIFRTVLKKLLDDQRTVRRTGERNPLIDFDFSFVVMPYRNELYGIIYSDQHKWVDEFKELDWVEDFSYWDNSDREENISASEWSKRRRVWDGILKQDKEGGGRPGSVGFNVECSLPTYGYPTTKVEDILQYMPGLGSRSLSAARDLIISEIMKAYDQEEVTRDPIHFMFKALDWLKTDDGKTALEERSAEVSEILDHELTTDLFSPPMPVENDEE